MYKLSEVKAKATSFLDTYKQRDPAAYATAQEAIGGLLILDGLIGIDNPLGGKKRPGIFGSLFGVIFGLVFVFVGLHGPSWFGVNKMTAQTTATVVSVGAPSPVTKNSDGSSSGGDCSMTVHYIVDGKPYSSQSSDSSTSYCHKSVGSTVMINYNPNNPGSWSADVGTVKFVFKVFLGAGILFAVVSLFTFFIRLLSIIFGWKLLRSGRALAKTLPEGASLGNLMSEIRTAFSHVLFGNAAQAAAAVQPMPVTPAQPATNQPLQLGQQTDNAPSPPTPQDPLPPAPPAAPTA